MAPREPATLQARARRAYELGRLRSACTVLLYVLPMVVISLGFAGSPAQTLVVGAALATVAVLFRWRGMVWTECVSAGLLAGALPLLAPLAVRLV
ncbi:MAG: hypothetical protein AB2A00_43620, partial [Myxococcota bacterium]